MDRGLTAFLVAATADGTEVPCITDPPKAPTAGMKQHVDWRSRRPVNGRDQTTAGTPRPGWAGITPGWPSIRQRFLHQVSNEVVKTHDRLAIKDPHHHRHDAQPAPGPRRSPTPLGPNSPVLLTYKQQWRGGHLKNHRSTAGNPLNQDLCPPCRTVSPHYAPGPALIHLRRVRVDQADRDHNAAVNLAIWARRTTPTRSEDLQAWRPGQECPPRGRLWPAPHACRRNQPREAGITFIPHPG